MKKLLETLIENIEINNTVAIESIVKNNDLSLRDNNGNTLLHKSILTNEYKVARLLISKHVDINVSNNDTIVPAVLAIIKGRNKIFDLLIKSGAEIILDEGKSTLLHQVCAYGRTDLIKIILEEGVLVDLKDESGRTPMMWAIQEKHYETICELIKLGANVNASDDDGFTPLIIASSEGFYNISKLLIQNGANVNNNTDVGTALHSSCVWGRKRIVSLLLKNGADVQAKDHHGRTALFYAVEYDHKFIIKLLLRNNADAKILG